MPFTQYCNTLFVKQSRNNARNNKHARTNDTTKATLDKFNTLNVVFIVDILKSKTLTNEENFFFLSLNWHTDIRSAWWYAYTVAYGQLKHQKYSLLTPDNSLIPLLIIPRSSNYYYPYTTWKPRYLVLIFCKVEILPELGC